MFIRLVLPAVLAIICSPLRADHARQVEEQVKPLIESDAIVGCVVGIVDQDQQEVHAFGEVSRGKGNRPDGNTIYEIGSVTKAFTGTLLADMAERGIVKLDAPLQKFLPEGVKLHVAKDKPITLLHLATHTSGLPRLPDNMAFKDPKNPYADYSPELMYAFLKDHKLQRPPGEYDYSNYGMGLLGHVLATKAGKSYEELVIETICKPLEMDDTRITLKPDQQERLAPPYDGQLEPDNNWDIDALAGAGALRSSANDMLKLLAAALSDDKRPVVRAIHKAWEPRHGKRGEIGVGLGWHLARDGITRWHDGQTGGYSAAVFAVEPKRLGVVVLSNMSTDLTTAMAEKVAQAALGMKPAPIAVRKAIKVPPKVLETYAGTYMITPFFGITITVEDGKLMAQATEQEKLQLFAESETKFFYKAVDAQITFVKDDQGKINKLVLHQNGQDVPGLKTAEANK